MKKIKLIFSLLIRLPLGIIAVFFHLGADIKKLFNKEKEDSGELGPDEHLETPIF